MLPIPPSTGTRNNHWSNILVGAVQNVGYVVVFDFHAPQTWEGGRNETPKAHQLKMDGNG